MILSIFLTKKKTKIFFISPTLLIIRKLTGVFGLMKTVYENCVKESVMRLSRILTILHRESNNMMKKVNCLVISKNLLVLLLTLLNSRDKWNNMRWKPLRITASSSTKIAINFISLMVLMTLKIKNLFILLQIWWILRWLTMNMILDNHMILFNPSFNKLLEMIQFILGLLNNYLIVFILILC